MITNHSTATVLSGIKWVLFSLMAWQLIALLRSTEWFSTTTHTVGVLEILLFTAIPALVAYAFIRLFLAVVQLGYGSFNAYTVTGSPWSLVFWLALAIGVVAHGASLSTGILLDQLPEAISNGEFAKGIFFLHDRVSLWLLGLAAIGISAPIIVLGIQARHHLLFGPERLLVALGSLITFGTTTLLVGVAAGHFLPAVLASGIVAALPFFMIPSGEVLRVPVGLLFVPGSAAGSIVLFGWALVAGGQPTWPW